MALFGESTYGNLTQIPELLGIASTMSEGTLGLGLWVMITFGAIFMTATSFNIRDSLIASSFISLITSLFLKYLNLLSDWFIVTAAIFFVGSLALAMTGKGRTIGG